MMIAAIIVFSIVYLLIATERINRVVAALVGAGVILAIGVVGSDDAFFSKETGIDWNVIFLLFGMMVIVGVLRQTGVFEYVAIWAAKKAKGRPFRVMTLLCLITAVASAGLGQRHHRVADRTGDLAGLRADRRASGPVPDRRGTGVQHRRHRHAGRRPTQPDRGQPVRARLQRLPDQHGARSSS